MKFGCLYFVEWFLEGTKFVSVMEAGCSTSLPKLVNVGVGVSLGR